MELKRLTDVLDQELRIDGFADDSHNGLQVANSGTVRRVACGVDASLETFEVAAAAGANLLIVHHGLSWGDSLKRLSGLNYRQVRFLVEHDLALWACHLPLDAHPRLGNNACLARALGLVSLQPFGLYHGQTIGWRGRLPRALPREQLARRLQRLLGAAPRVMPFGAAAIRSVGIISGGAAAEVAQAAASGLDAYISGEPTLQGYNLARQLGVNALFGGHYATERWGVQAVGAWLRRRFKLPVELVELNVPY